MHRCADGATRQFVPLADSPTTVAIAARNASNVMGEAADGGFLLQVPVAW
jgi:hypothetical protein